MKQVKKQTTTRKRGYPHAKLDVKLKLRLLDLLFKEKMKIKDAAETLKINYNSAKTIWRSFRLDYHKTKSFKQTIININSSQVHEIFESEKKHLSQSQDNEDIALKQQFNVTTDQNSNQSLSSKTLESNIVSKELNYLDSSNCSKMFHFKNQLSKIEELLSIKNTLLRQVEKNQKHINDLVNVYTNLKPSISLSI